MKLDKNAYDSIHIKKQHFKQTLIKSLYIYLVQLIAREELKTTKKMFSSAKTGSVECEVSKINLTNLSI